MNRRGVTFIELMVVVTLIGILAAIALPRLSDARRDAQAAQIIGDFHAVRLAAYDAFAGNGAYPATAGWGVVPADLVPSLPANFSFQPQGDIRYRWRRWSLPNGLPQAPDQTELLGLDVEAADPRLIDDVRGLFGGRTLGSGGSVTLIIE